MGFYKSSRSPDGDQEEMEGSLELEGYGQKQGLRGHELGGLTIS